MEKLFGDYFVKYTEPTEDQEAAAAEESKDVPEDEAGPSIIERKSCYERVSVEDALIKTECPYVALLFTADYAPPCAQF